MKKVLTSLLVCLFIVVAVRASEKLQHRVKLTQVNEWQALVSCRNGRTPKVNTEIAGNLIISCEGREE
jgi:ABC-type uncharacterized transport system substrate-binding protein